MESEYSTALANSALCRRQDFPNECPEYDTKPSDGEQ